MRRKDRQSGVSSTYTPDRLFFFFFLFFPLDAQTQLTFFIVCTTSIINFRPVSEHGLCELFHLGQSQHCFYRRQLFTVLLEQYTLARTMTVVTSTAHLDSELLCGDSIISHLWIHGREVNGTNQSSNILPIFFERFRRMH